MADRPMSKLRKRYSEKKRGEGIGCSGAKTQGKDLNRQA